MKFPLILLIYLLSYKISIGQSLSIDETINYINELSKQVSTEFQMQDCSCKHHQILNINNEGLIKITEYRNLYKCKYSKDNSFPTYEYSFYLDDINCNEIQIDKIIGWIAFPCKNNASNIRKYRLFESIDNSVTKEEFISKFTLSVANDHSKQKFLNAYKYLFNQMSLSGKFKRVDNDPFVSKITMEGNNSNYSIPLMEKGSVYNTAIMIGNRKFNFILDSGAGEVNISKEVEEELVSLGLIKKADYLTNGLYRLADGSVVICRRVLLNNLKIGNCVVSKVTASIGGPSSPLLLGRSFLNRFTKWTIDNKRSILILER